jgi:hypothetical protein
MNTKPSLWTKEQSDNNLAMRFTINRSLSKAYRSTFVTFIKSIPGYVYSELDFYLSVTDWFENGWSYLCTYQQWLDRNFQSIVA